MSIVGEAAAFTFVQLANTLGITWDDANESTQEERFQVIYDACLKVRQQDTRRKIETCRDELAPLSDFVGHTVLDFVTAVQKEDPALFERFSQRNIALDRSNGYRSALLYLFSRTFEEVFAARQELLEEQSSYGLQSALRHHFSRTFEEVLAVRQEFLEANEPAILMTLDNIGLCLLALGKTQEALEKFKEVLDLRQNFLAADDPVLAISFNNIGSFLTAHADSLDAIECGTKYCKEVRKLRKKAKEHHKNALDIQEKTMSADHPNIATSHHGIGIFLYNQFMHREALTEHEKALALRKKSLAPNHPDIARSLYEVGRCHIQCNRHHGVNKYFKQAYEIAFGSLGGNNPTTKLYWETYQRRKNSPRDLSDFEFVSFG